MLILRVTFMNLMWFYLILHMDLSDCCINNASQPLKPTIKAISNKQSLMVSWLVNHSESVTDMFEIQISRTEKHSIVHNTILSTLSRESREQTWTWISELPLECVDHSVRIRNICNGSAQSPWSDWTTSYGEIAGNKAKIFPFQQVLREGSSPTFCCIPPPGTNITGMAFRNNPYNLMSVGDKVKAFVVNNLTIPKERIKRLLVSCSITNGNRRHVFNYVSFPPQKPRNISCATTDFTSVTCRWESGRNESTDHNKPNHTLHIQNTDHSPVHCDRSPCTFPVVPQLQVYNITVVVKNLLGEESENCSFNISERVSPVVEWDKVDKGGTDANVSWSIQGNLTQNKFICQVSTLQHSITKSCDGARGFCKVRLKPLLPNTPYRVLIRCSVNGNLWGDWTKPRYFTTDPQVTLDLWRRIQQLSDSYDRRVSLLWKQHVAGTVKIQKYRVQWSQEGQTWKDLNVDGEQNKTEISIGLGKCEINVEAVVHTGSSIPAHIVIPPMDPAESLPVQKLLSSSTVGGFYLSWNEKTTVTCGYTVEWCILGNTVPCILQWMKVPKENNTLYLPAGNFKSGCRYTFNIYGCTENGDKLLETQTGYSQELISVQIPRLVEPVQSTSSSVTLEWRYNEDDPAEPAFITGYLVTVQDAGYDVPTGQAAYRFNVSVADPRKKSVTIEGLQQDKEYSFSVSALTKYGRGVPANITIRTTINYSYLAMVLTAIFIFLGCIIIIWSRRKELKEVFVYPSGMNIKIPEFDSFLHETEQMLCSQTMDECTSCDIEIVTKSKPEIINTPCSDGSPSPLTSLSRPLALVQEDYSPQSASLFWDRPAFKRKQSFTNKSYLTTVRENCFEQQQATLTEIKSSFAPSDCLPESCDIIYGYISYDIL